MIHVQFMIILINLVISLSFFISFMVSANFTEIRKKAALIFFSYHEIILFLYFFQNYQYLFTGSYNASLCAYIGLFINLMILVDPLFYYFQVNKRIDPVLLTILLISAFMNIIADILNKSVLSRFIVLGVIATCALFAVYHARNKKNESATRKLLTFLAAVKLTAIPFLILDILKEAGHSGNPLILERMSFFPFYLSLTGIAIFLVYTSSSKKQNENKQQETTFPNDFTRREKETAQLIIQGLSNKEIADELFISESTVKKHVNSLFKKTEVNSRLKLIETLKS